MASMIPAIRVSGPAALLEAVRPFGEDLAGVTRAGAMEWTESGDGECIRAEVSE